jgi:hypothetical protein
MKKLTIDERILVEVLGVLDTTISLLESSKSMHFPRILAAYNDLRVSVRDSEYNADPSCTTVGLAEMILSDCGCSSNNTLLVSRVANRIDTHIQAEKQVPEHQPPMPFVPWSKEAEMMESWTHEQQPVKPIAERVSDLVERLGGIEYLESRSSKPVQKPLTYEQIQQLYIKAYNGGDHGRDFETAFVKEIETAHGITGIRE